MRILITGGSGLLGSKLAELATRKGHEVYAGYSSHKPMNGMPIRFNISNRNDVIKTFERVRPNAVVHAAAMTDVDKCEVERETAWKVNVEGTKNVVEASKRSSTYLVYVSTDYVFNGSKGMYREDDECNPVNYYGLTKLEGENEVKHMLHEWCIVRPSVIFGVSPAAGKMNFALWILNKLRRGEYVRVVDDQWVSPTFNTNLSEMILEVVERRLTGIYHLAGATRTSRFEMAKSIAEIFKLDVSLIESVKMSEIPWRARRPRDSSLDVSKAKSILKNQPYELNRSLTEFKAEFKVAITSSK